MLNKFLIVWIALSGCGAGSAFGHLGYGGRDFGSFSGASPSSVTLENHSIASNFGWADGTDADFGDSHRLRIFRFTLFDTAWVTITAQASTNGGSRLGTLLPGISLYSGLAHLTPAAPDHDFAAITAAYLAALPGPAKEGAFNALATWKVGNDDGATFDDLTTFTYVGHVADGGAANFGSTPGIHGDGLADGYVTGSWLLEPGDYSFFVGGAFYDGQSPTPDAGSYGLTASVSAVPEPTASMLAAVGGVLLAMRRRSRRQDGAANF